MSRQLFIHGVHPPDNKELTAGLHTRRMPFPDEVVLPLRQHIGAPATPVVKPGDEVDRGDVIAEPNGFVSVPLHASVTGTVRAIELWPHPDGSTSEAIRIEVEQSSAQLPAERVLPRWQEMSNEDIVGAVRDAGVVGMGGAAFPTHVKLTPPKEGKLDLLLLNGCECEPYLTADHRVMLDYPERVFTGARIMMRCLDVERAIIGVEDNKPDAIAKLREVAPDDIDISVRALPVKYPQGAEKMLIKALTGREVPPGQLPLSMGVVVQNVASIATIAEVFETGLPLIERVVTVTGRGVAKPSNLVVPVGTKLTDLLEACGGLTDDACEVLIGGPMMGFAQSNLDAPVLKGATGVVVLSDKEARQRRQYPCIRCGHCVDACPVFLNPQALGELSLVARYDEMKADHHLDTCMLCGCCSYVCPSNIPLSQLFSVAKAALKRQAAT
jgi:electron transport complex protein RnfC